MRFILLLVVMSLASPAFAGQEAEDGALVYGKADAPTKIILVANATCDGCSEIFGLLFDPRFKRDNKTRFSSLVTAIEAGEIQLTYRPYYRTNGDVSADMLARCARHSGEVHRRLSSNPDLWHSFEHPQTEEKIGIPESAAKWMLQQMLVSDLIAEGGIKTCLEQTAKREDLIAKFKAFQQKFPDIELPAVSINEERSFGLTKVRSALFAAVSADEKTQAPAELADSLDRLSALQKGKKDAPPIYPKY